MLLEEAKTKLIEFYNGVAGRFTHTQAAGILLLLGLIVTGVLVLHWRSRPVAVEFSTDKQTKRAGEEVDRQSPIFVHVGGAVENPGVYRLSEGDRVFDAIRKAGGERAEASVDAINLAAKLEDGQKLYLPSKGELEVSSGPRGPGSEARPPRQSGVDARINLNTASKAELEELPGIGSVIADRILERRERDRFGRVDELNDVEGIGPKKFDQLKDKVVAE